MPRVEQILTIADDERRESASHQDFSGRCDPTGQESAAAFGQGLTTAAPTSSLIHGSTLT